MESFFPPEFKRLVRQRNSSCIPYMLVCMIKVRPHLINNTPVRRLFEIPFNPFADHHFLSQLRFTLLRFFYLIIILVRHPIEIRFQSPPTSQKVKRTIRTDLTVCQRQWCSRQKLFGRSQEHTSELQSRENLVC